MADMRELNMNEMEQATGGVYRTVNTGVPGLNAAVRSGPSKGSKQIASLVNGTLVDTVSDRLIWDEAAGRNFVEVTFTVTLARKPLAVSADTQVKNGTVATAAPFADPGETISATVTANSPSLAEMGNDSLMISEIRRPFFSDTPRSPLTRFFRYRKKRTRTGLSRP